MKKLLLSLVALVALAAPVAAQKYLDIYQGDKVIGSVLTTDADSVYIMGDDPTSRRIYFASGGHLLNSYFVNAIDSIKIFHADEQPWVYLGILGFNQELYEMPLAILAPSTSTRFTNFVSGLTRKDGTLLYYGVEHALDMLALFPYKTPVSSVNLITFTDGLDQGSFFMTDRYSTETDYLSALNSRIRNDRVLGLPITAYSLGLRGTDVTDYTQFQANLRQLASSEDKATEVTSMSDVRRRLQSIADEIINISISNQQTLAVKIPGPSNGTHVCFTFDSKTPEQSSLYIEGTFNLSDRSLRNVTYHGLRATSGSTVAGQQQGIFVTYTFTGLQRLNSNELIPMSYIRQYNRPASSSTWQINSEFTPGNNTQTQTIVTHSGAIILLVLDCSSSLGSQFSDMQSYARDFISRVAQNAVDFKLTAPAGVTASLDIENDAWVVKLSWGAVKFAESYIVYRSNNASNGFVKVAEGITSTIWRDESPLSGDNYYRIVAVGHGLTSEASSTSDVVKCVIEAPTNVTATMGDEEMVINVSWDAVKYAESYIVYRNNKASSGFVKVAEGVTSTMWRDETPLSGNNYYYIVAVGHGLTSKASSTSDVVKCVIEAPTNVTATWDDEAMIVNVSWDAVQYAESYSVYRNGTLVASGIKATEWTDDNPAIGNNSYQVEAVSHGLTSGKSQTASVRTRPSWVEGKSFTVNGVSFYMVKVEGGTFQMGSTSGDSDEQPVHSVTLTKDYYMGETEVTQALWYAVMGQSPTSDGYQWESTFGLGDQYPAYRVSWNDCQTFITKLNALTGVTFRLPTEAEWEYAAKGGKKSNGYTYAGSNTIGDVAWYLNNSGNTTHAVGTKAANELGLYDMSGNVWEWCQDWYGSYSSEAQTDPTGPTSGSYRVYRGGGWNYGARFCRVAFRDGGTPGDRFGYLGLRLAL